MAGQKRWLLRNNTSASLITSIDDEKLKRAVALGNCSGNEMVKPEEGGEWAPLHSLPWFMALAAETGDAAAVAKKRGRRHVSRVVLGILGTYTGAVTFIALLAAATEGKPGAIPMAAFVGSGLGAWIYSVIKRRRKALDRFEQFSEVASAESAASDPLEAAIVSLEQDLQKNQHALASSVVHPGTLRQCAQLLREQKAVLSALVQRDQREQRLKELGAARQQLASATDQGLREALADQIRALEEHDTAAARAESAMQDNLSRAAALLHEIEAVRAAVATAAVDQRIENDVVDRLAEVQRQIVDADVEIEETERHRGSKRAIGPGE